MAKIYFYYGAMGSSKTANALMTEYNYSERGQHPLLSKSGLDTRDGKYIMHSRIGLQKECILLSDICRMKNEELLKYDVIIVDEIQFASRAQIDQLVYIADHLDIPILCYGLKIDFQMNLFEGSERLLEVADKIIEIKTMCWCGKKATCNARYNEKGIVREGAQIVMGANDKYIALCRKHYIEGRLHENS